MIRVAVRTLVEHVLRAGDLKPAFFAPSRSVQAIRLHQRIQAARPAAYTPEVSVSRRIEARRFDLLVGGRIDGLYLEPTGHIRVEEIKTTTGDPVLAAAEENPLHWGQLKLYAHLAARDHRVDRIWTRLVYADLDGGTTLEVVREFGARELERFFDTTVQRYLDWAETVAAWRDLRNRSLRSVSFPYPDYRPGQRELAVDAYRTVSGGGQLLVQAATGIGKTMAVLFPALKALGLGGCEKIFYLTARTTGRTAAENALDLLRPGGLRAKSLTLTAKDKICFHPEAACSPDQCPYAAGHFDRLNPALARLFAEDSWTRQSVVAAARRDRVCPFEFSLELALWADVVICDYNYAFDPRVYLRRFFAEEEGDYAFLVDEAHNLADRSRDMFSAEIRKQPFLDLRRAVKPHLPGLYRQMGRISRWMAERRRAVEDDPRTSSEASAPVTLLPLVHGFLRGAERWLVQNRAAEFREDLLELYFAAIGFLRVADGYDDAYATLYRVEGRDFRVKLFCTDPSGQLGAALHRCRSCIFFSATLTPGPYFKTLFGCDPHTPYREVPSPFPRENFGLFRLDGVSTLYRSREKTAPAVTGAITALVGARKGNYLLFFPSYTYMNSIYEHFCRRNPQVETLLQTPGMSEEDRESFLAAFLRDDLETLVGFAVMGGIFGEGIDLTGDRLSGAAVVGVGLPAVDPEKELIRRRFDDRLGAGFDYAYRFPGINRVLQAAGRVIRSSRDRGAVVLIDSRFSTADYRSLLPATWHPVAVRSEEMLKTRLAVFWKTGEPRGGSSPEG